MTLILDSSEIHEAVALASELTATLNLSTLIHEKKVGGDKTPIVATKTIHKHIAAQNNEIDPSKLEYRDDQLEQVIKNMCQRSHFKGAIVIDDTGLPFAAVNPPVSIEALSALAVILGASLERADSLLNLQGAEYLSIDINYEEKIILRRFLINDAPYFILAVCPQEIDERSEIEISIDQIVSILNTKQNKTKED